MMAFRSSEHRLLLPILSRNRKSLFPLVLLPQLSTLPPPHLIPLSYTDTFDSQIWVRIIYNVVVPALYRLVRWPSGYGASFRLT